MPPDELEHQRRISEMLAAQPSPTMPDDVRERIDAALAAEPALTSPRRRGVRSWLMPLGAAAAIVALVGVVVIPQLDDTNATPLAACPVTVGPDSDLRPLTQSTGTTYTRAGFGPQTKQLLDATPACSAAREQVTQDEAPASGTDVAEPAAPVATDEAVGDAAMQCLVRVIPGQRVMAVDHARYLGEDVLVTVVASAPNRAMVVDCSPPPPRVVYRADLE